MGVCINNTVPDQTPSPVNNGDISLNKEIYNNITRKAVLYGIYTISLDFFSGQDEGKSGVVITRQNFTAPNREEDNLTGGFIKDIIDSNNFIIRYNKGFGYVDYQYKYYPGDNTILETPTNLIFKP